MPLKARLTTTCGPLRAHPQLDSRVRTVRAWFASGWPLIQYVLGSRVCCTWLVVGPLLVQ